MPNLEKEKTRLPISTVVMSSQRVVPDDALFTVPQKIAGTVANPLVHDGLKLIPSVTRTFSAGQPLFILLEAYERDASAVRPLLAYATFFRDGVKVLETAIHAVEAWNPQTRAVAIRLFIAPGALGPAIYDCQVTVLDPTTKRAAFWSGSVTFVR